MTKLALIVRSLGLAAVLSTAQSLYAQLAYGVDSTGSLFSFNISNPTAVTTIGNLGITSAAIDFRPGTSTLYAFGVSGGTARLYTVNTTTGVATGVGAGFASSVLGGATSFAFDFNPTTLQGDGSIRIRLVGNNGVNLRLHSDTGLVAATDTSINGVAGATVNGAAYTNTNVATIGGTTALYYVDSTNDALLLSSNPNGGVVGSVGTLGFDAFASVGFDIVTGTSSNTGYIVNTTGANAANLYTVDLATGATTLAGALSRDFTGGFAIVQTSPVPEPSTYAAIAGVAVIGLAVWRRRRAA